MRPPSQEVEPDPRGGGEAKVEPKPLEAVIQETVRRAVADSDGDSGMRPPSQDVEPDLPEIEEAKGNLR